MIIRSNCTDCGKPIEYDLFRDTYKSTCLCPDCYDIHKEKASENFESYLDKNKKLTKCEACSGSGKIKGYVCQNEFYYI